MDTYWSDPVVSGRLGRRRGAGRGRDSVPLDDWVSDSEDTVSLETDLGAMGGIGGRGSNSPLLSTGCAGVPCQRRDDVIDAVMKGDDVMVNAVTGSTDVMDDVMACADVMASVAVSPWDETLPLRLLRRAESAEGFRLGWGRVADCTELLWELSSPCTGEILETSVNCVIWEVKDLESRSSSFFRPCHASEE